jgi:transposase
MSKEKQILHLRSQGYSQRRIAETLHVSRNTVAKVFNAAVRISLNVLPSMDDESLRLALFPEKAALPVQELPDYAYMHKELLKSGVTLKLLWEEYVNACRQSSKAPFMYSQFCKLYQDYVDQNHLTMHIRHKPGDKLMVDWAGTSLPLYNKVTGQSCKVYLFVATLPFSMYCYAEACRTMKEEDWIHAHINMYAFLGGVARMLISDNLKVGVVQHRKHEDPVINRSYQELADHYQTALLPARILAPKDKAAVEGSVGQLTSHIIARLRNQKFFELSAMNRSIRKELERFNQADFQKKDGSRASVFEEEEFPFMQSLPQYLYEFAQWKMATVQLNYHIALDNMNYSVPYSYVKKKVDVRYTKSMVEILYHGSRICSHKRLYGQHGQYSTIIQHMPINHQLYSEWDAKRFLRWAETVGPSVKETVQKVLTSYRIEEQAYKSCLALLKLAEKYSPERLQNACHVALEHIPVPRYKNIRLILEAGQDKAALSIKEQTNEKESGAFVRGAAYYGGMHHE